METRNVEFRPGDESRADESKIKSTRRGFLRRAGILSAGAVLSSQEAEAANLLIPEGGKIIEKKNSDGAIEFSHSDPETTHILEIVSGFAAIDNRDRINILRARFVDAAINFKSYLGKSVEEWQKISEADLINAYIKSRFQNFLKTESGEFNVQELVPFIQEQFIKNPELLFPLKKHERNKKLYESLWRAEKRLNNPKINWGIAPNPGGGVRSIITRASGNGLVELNGARYAPATNTLFIHELNFSDWASLAEFYLPKAKQVATSEEYNAIQEAAGILGPRLREQIVFEEKIKDSISKAIVRAKFFIFEGDKKVYDFLADELELKFKKHIVSIDAYGYDKYMKDLEKFKSNLEASDEFKAKKTHIENEAREKAKAFLKNELGKIAQGLR